MFPSIHMNQRELSVNKSLPRHKRHLRDIPCPIRVKERPPRMEYYITIRIYANKAALTSVEGYVITAYTRYVSVEFT